MTLVAKAGSAVVLLISSPAPEAPPQVAKSGTDKRHAPKKLGACLDEDPAGYWARPRRASKQQAASNQAVLYHRCRPGSVLVEGRGWDDCRRVAG